MCIRDRRYTVTAGLAAGTILSLVYLMLAYMGMKSSAVYPIQENGAWTLRCIVSQLFGGPGAVLLAAIFTLACLTTCVGLITSISQFFSGLTKMCIRDRFHLFFHSLLSLKIISDSPFCVNVFRITWNRLNLFS